MLDKEANMAANSQPGKEELEKQKLQTEIEEIKLKIEQGKKRIEFERGDASKEHIRSWTTILIALITIITGWLTIGERVITFFSQAAQEQKIKISQEMLKLVAELKSEDEDKREDAVLLLSEYEMEAVPILLRNLEFSNDPASTIESLQLIRERPGVKDKAVLTALLGKAKSVFVNDLKKLPTSGETITVEQAYAEKSIANFIIALKELYGKKPKEIPKEIKILFQQWKNEIESRQPPIKEDNKKGLIDRLTEEKG